jgi:hypothetical protein
MSTVNSVNFVYKYTPHSPVLSPGVAKNRTLSIRRGVVMQSTQVPKSRFFRLRTVLTLALTLSIGVAVVTVTASPAQAYATSAIADNAETHADGTFGDQCKVFVGNVVQAVAGFYPSGYQQGFANAGAVEITNPASAVRGDIIQITPAGSTDATAEDLYQAPYTSSNRLHTTIIRAPRNADGTFNVIDSNWSNTNDMLVRRHTFNPYTWASGSIIKIWRFGTGGSGGGTPSPGQAARSDTDNNGCGDLVMTTNEATGSKAFTLLSTCLAFLSPQQWWDGAGYGWSGVTPLVGDVDGDGYADYVFLTDEGANGTKAFVATSSGGDFHTPQLWWNGVGVSYSSIKASLGDVDNYLGEDLVIMTNEPTGSKSFVMLSTTISFQSPQLWWNGTGLGWSGVTPFVSDVNGDHKADFVYLTNEGANGTKGFVAISSGAAFGTGQLWWNGVGLMYGGIKPAMGDADGNGCADLIIVTNEPTGSKAFVLLATCLSFLSPQLWWNGTGLGWSGITPLAGDVNGDKKADFVYLTNEGANGTKGFVAKSTGSGFTTPQLWWNGTGLMYGGIKAYLK